MPNRFDNPSACYRDNLHAAITRAEYLETRLAAAEAQLAQRQTPTPGRPKQNRHNIVFRRSATYFPLLRLWADGILRAKERVPDIPDPQWGSVVGTALYWVLGVPLICLLRILYTVHLFLLVTPWTLFLSLVLSVPMALILFLASFRFADGPRASIIDWANNPGAGSHYLFLMLSVAGQPLLPLFVPGWNPND